MQLQSNQSWIEIGGYRSNHQLVICLRLIKDMKEKIKRIAVPKHMSIVPVLLHIGGVQDEVLDAQFFAKVCDNTELLECSQK